MITCCEEFSNALEACTDKEAYGSLIRRDGDTYVFGSQTPTIRFCPWCGADKRKKSKVHEAARKVTECMFGPTRGEWDDLKDAIGELYTALETESR